jgi:hypothetical protein
LSKCQLKSCFLDYRNLLSQGYLNEDCVVSNLLSIPPN